MDDNEFSTKKSQLSSASLASVFSIDNDWVINGIFNLYEVLLNETDVNKGKSYTRHVDDLYNEWLLDYHANSEHIDITKLGNMINILINKFDLDEIDSYKLLFVTETYFIMIIKLLVANFVEHLKNKHDVPEKLSWSYITVLFWNNDPNFDDQLKDLFEVSYYEWFVSVSRNDNKKIYGVINDTWIKIKEFNINPSMMNLSSIYSLFNGVYLNLFGKNHFNFTDKVNNVNKGFPNFYYLITSKAIHVLVHFLKLDNNYANYSASASMYMHSYNVSETNLADLNVRIISIRTSVGDFHIPKLDSFQHMKLFIDQLHDSISSFKSFNSFWEMVQKNNSYGCNIKVVASSLYEKLMILRTPIQYDFWTMNIKHKITPDLF